MPDIDDALTTKTALNANETENAVKGVDPSEIEKDHNTILQGIAKLNVDGANCEIVSASSSSITIRLKTVYNRVGMLSNGNLVRAKHVNPSGGAVTEWRKVATGDDDITFTDSNILSGTLSQDYSTFAIADFTFEIDRPQVKIGVKDIALGSHAGALHLDDLQLSSTDTSNAGTNYSDFKKQVEKVVDTTTGVIKTGVVTPASLDPDMQTQHFTNTLPFDVNLSFEYDDDLDGVGNGWTLWNGGTASLSTTYTKWHPTVQKFIATQAQDGITFTTSRIDALTEETIFVAVEVYIASGTHNVVIETNDGTTTTTSTQICDTSKWTTISITPVITAGATNIIVRIYADGAGTFYLDGFQMGLGATVPGWTRTAYESYLQETRKAPDNLIYNARFNHVTSSTIDGAEMNLGYATARNCALSTPDGKLGLYAQDLTIGQDGWWHQAFIRNATQGELYNGKIMFGSIWFQADTTNLGTEIAYFYIADSTNNGTTWVRTEYPITLTGLTAGTNYILNMERTITARDVNAIAMGVRSKASDITTYFHIHILAMYASTSGAKFYNKNVPPPLSGRFKEVVYHQGINASPTAGDYASIGWDKGAGSATFGDVFNSDIPIWGCSIEGFAGEVIPASVSDIWTLMINDSTAGTSAQLYTGGSQYAKGMIPMPLDYGDVKQGFVTAQLGTAGMDSTHPVALTIKLIFQE